MHALRIIGFLIMVGGAGLAILNPLHAQTVDALSTINQRVMELYNAGKYGDAIPLARQYAEGMKVRHGADHPEYATALNNLAELLRLTNRHDEAEPLMRYALSIDEKALGRDHPKVAIRLNNLAELLRTTNRLAEAEPLYLRALNINEATFGPEHMNVAGDLNNLALLLRANNRLAEAEILIRRALSIVEKTVGPDSPYVAIALSTLAGVLQDTHRLAEAEPLLRRALAIDEKGFGPDHPKVATRCNNLAQLLVLTKRLDEAEPMLRRALAIDEKNFGSEHPNVAADLNNLAALLLDANRAGAAEPLMRRALLIDEKSLGAQHPNVAIRLNNLAEVLRSDGRPAEAETLYRRAALLMEQVLGRDYPNMAIRNLALLRAEQGDWVEAAELYRRAKPSLIAMRSPDDVGERMGLARLTLTHSSGTLRSAARAVYRSGATEAHQESFELAQWALQTAAADALAQMSARFTQGAGPLAQLVRERQDLLSRRHGEDKRLLAALGQADSNATGSIRAAIQRLDAGLDAIDRRLRTEFPEYAAFANAEPQTIAGVQALLRTNEALILFLDVPRVGRLAEESLVWAVTPSEVRLVEISLGTRALGERVAALRCGLDQTAWDGEGASRCVGLLKGDYQPEDAAHGKPLPFDLVRAHELYQVLFGRLEDLIRDKHLLVVPSGPLTAFPFHALITEKPAVAVPTGPAGYATVAWLTKRHAVTVLPAVASLKALRQFARASKAAQPFIGFGNPLLLGPDGTDRRAWERQSCSAPRETVRVGSRGPRSAISKFFRSGLANVDEVRTQYPLPETADELCAVAQSSGAASDAVYLGAEATETKIKALSANGTLATARVVHFATHGLLAGETEMLAVSKAEPALILTPPQTASEENDGLLTASEIAQLKLDADWVVLSACNTAAGESDKPGAEALSGLARAFFYSGARALLVSHWAVNSDATVTLITNAFDELKAGSKVSRSEALRRSMLALIAAGGGNAHPASWAPFVVVGEGAN